MLKIVLVPLGGQPADRALLESARLLAQSDGGHLDCLFVCADAAKFASHIAADNMGVPFITPELMAAMEESDRNQKYKAQANFREFCQAHGIVDRAVSSAQSGISASLQEPVGDLVTVITRRARYSDATVFQRGPSYSTLSADGIGRVLVECGRPVILLPEKPISVVGRKIAIAWKPTAEAARAVAMAMPLLRKAEKVVIFAAQEEDDTAADNCKELGDALKWHGIHAQTGSIAHGKASAAEAVLSEAEYAHADLLIMGAYGHSRAREFLFGGFTKYALENCTLPVMLVH